MYPQLTAALRRAAQISPGILAVSDRFGSYEWPEFTRRVARVASGLQGLGVGEGDRVAILSDNSGRFLEFYFAALWAGAIAVPLNTRTAHRELELMLDDCAPRVVAASGEFEPLIASIHKGRPGKWHGVSFESEPHFSGFRPYDSLPGDDELADSGRGGNDTASIYYTGGTSGVSKGVMLSHANLVANALGMIAPLKLGPGTRHLHATPMFHIAASAGMFGTTLAGGSHYFLPRFEPTRVLEQIEALSITHTSLVPTMVARITSSPNARNFDVHSLQVIFYGGSPMPERTIDEIIDLMPDVQIVQGYGLTETSPTLTLLTHDDHVNPACQDRRRSAGQAALGVELAILDDAGQQVEAGVSGQVCARGATVTPGYWNRPELTEEAMQDGWFHTGDIGFLDRDGYLFVVDRLKDMIITGGENVYSIEVENVIFQHPSVDMCAVIGLPSVEWGERVHAIVASKAGCVLTEEEVLQHCRERLAGYKVPKTADIRTIQWPISAAGKVLKSQLKREYM